ncbi:MAG: phosphoadenosine phosphosulfate reductase family protein, partial [Cetobacterium sp.]
MYDELIVSVSGGKDSTVVEHMIRDIYSLFPHRILFGNTSNETHYTYKYIKEMYGSMNLDICSPKEGFFPWVRRNKFVPTRFSRACCSIFKEGNITPYLDNTKKLLQICGIRRDESATRSKYEQVRKGKWENKLAQENWDMYLPIIDFNDLDVWSYILSNELEFNPMYQFNNRCGCSMCPYRSDYELQIAEHYMPTYAKNWKKLIGDIFDSEGLAINMNCTKEEFLDGAWKAGIVREEPTQEVIEDFAKHKGIDVEQAQKYFKKNRCSCGKRLSKDMIG